MTKKMLSMSIATVAVLGLASLAMAHGWGNGFGYNHMRSGNGYGYGRMMGTDAAGFNCPYWGSNVAERMPHEGYGPGRTQAAPQAPVLPDYSEAR